MLIDARASLLVFHCLRCWDQHDELLQDIVWFNTDTLVASVRCNGTEERVEVGRFNFVVQLPTTQARLLEQLPPELHNKVEL